MRTRNQTRRQFLKTLTAGAAAVAGLRCASPVRAAGPARKPNVLFIISDDLCTSLGAYGHLHAKTPNLDRLAARGVQFERAYCQFPVCGPSRASIMTGMYPRALRATGNRQSDFRNKFPDIVTLPQLFRQNGYYTARVSKIYHMGVPGDILEGSSGLDDPLSWVDAVNIKGPEQYAPGDSTDLSPKVTHQGVDFVRVLADGDDLVHADGQAADKAVELLGAHKDEPFFLAVGMVRPHVPLAAPRDYFDPYRADDMVIPEVPEGDLDDVPEAARFQTNAVKYGMSVEQQREVLAAYCATVAYMDAQVGKVLDELERLGLADDTIVVFMSDHGYNLGQHTCWQKLSLFEDSVRVPFIVATPGQKGKRTCQRVIELLDLYPTLAEVCGLDLPHELHGESFARLLHDPEHRAFADNAAYTITRNSGESLRTERWRFNLWKDGGAGMELYDLDNDPGEFTNLAEESAHADVVASLKERLIAARENAMTLPG
ncbi:MAG: sulfatase-like hydrolase/transferase [bacterium]|nr:sulfatase-like hydrolase/transferase [bacterium]